MTQVETKFGCFVRAAALICLLMPFAAGVLVAQHVQQGEDGRVSPQLDSMKMTPEEQIALGERIDNRVRPLLPLLPDSSPVTKYVQAMGRRLAAKAPGYAWPYTFRVIATKEIDSMALPGGLVYITLGTIQVTDESQLASILAHQMAHVVLQQTARHRKLVLKYARTEENEADLLTAQILYDADYDPFVSTDLFQRLAEQPGDSSTFLRSHPSAGRRGERIGEAIQKFPSKTYSRVDGEEFQAMKQQADSMRTFTGDDLARHAGLWEFDAESSPTLSAAFDNLTYAKVRPYGEWKTQKEKGLSFDYPEEWEVTHSEGRTLLAPAGAISPTGAMAYGLSIQANKDGAGLDEASHGAAMAMVRSTPGMKLLDLPGRITVSGRTAIAYELACDSPMQQGEKALREHRWLVTMQRSDSTFLNLLFVAPERDYSALKETYRRILGSVRVD